MGSDSDEAGKHADRVANAIMLSEFLEPLASSRRIRLTPKISFAGQPDPLSILALTDTPGRQRTRSSTANLERRPGSAANGARDKTLFERPGSANHPAMSNATEDLLQVCDALPPEKQAEVVDFARFLLAQQDDAKWEGLLAYPKSRPKLDAFLRESATEGEEPLNPERL